MPANKCIFQKGWLLKYPLGVDNADSKVKASCKVCRTDIDIASMVESALKSHQKSAKHQRNTGVNQCDGISLIFVGYERDIHTGILFSMQLMLFSIQQNSL